MTIKKKLILSIGLPTISALIISLLLISYISSVKISDEMESSLAHHNKIIVDSVKNLISNSAKSYLIAANEIIREDESFPDNISGSKFLEEGYVYLVNENGIIIDHPDPTLIGIESINREWLLSYPKEETGFLKYVYLSREKILYKYYDPELKLFVLSSSYIDHYSKSITESDIRSVIGNIDIGNIGKTGYPFILTVDGLCISHPDKKFWDTNISDLQDADGNFFIQEILMKKHGKLEYNWIDENGSKQKKSMYYTYDTVSELIIASTVYVSDFYKSVYEVIRTVALTSIILLFSLTIIFLKYADSFVKPIVRLSEISKEITKGNLDQNFTYKDSDEIATLGNNFLFMQESIKNSMNQLEEAVKNKTEKLEEAQHQLIQSEKLSSLGRMVAGIAHEINTPIGIGVTAASHLQNQTDKLIKEYHDGFMTQSSFENYMEETSVEAKILLDNMNRAAALVHSFKKVSVDQTTEINRRFDVKHYIEDLLLSIKHQIKDKEINVIIECEKRCVIDSYPGAFSQIMTNLILNSYIHGFEGMDSGEIVINLKTIDSYLILNYRDNGIGVPKENINKIFDPFFTTKRNRGGTGLGLHLVNNIIYNKLKGTIIYRENNNSGVEFDIAIPVIAQKALLIDT